MPTPTIVVRTLPIVSEHTPHAYMMSDVTLDGALSISKAKSLPVRCVRASMEAVGGKASTAREADLIRKVGPQT